MKLIAVILPHLLSSFLEILDNTWLWVAEELINLGYTVFLSGRAVLEMSSWTDWY